MLETPPDGLGTPLLVIHARSGEPALDSRGWALKLDPEGVEVNDSHGWHTWF